MSSRFRILKRVGLALILGLGLLAAVLLIRAVRFTSKQVRVPPAPDAGVDARRVAEHLAGAIRFRTISDAARPRNEDEAFRGLLAYLEETFPRTYATLSKETVGEYSLLFTWEGRDRGLEPMLLAAHMDVVPAEGVETAPRHDWGQSLMPLMAPVQADAVRRAAASNPWRYPPFEGRIAEGFLWGRGTLDDKVSVLGILEAVEMLLGQGFQPRRTILLAFGQDEEVGGTRGAAAIAGRLHARGVRLGCVLDEGSSLVQGVLPGIAAPIALVGTVEKGYVDVALRVEGQGGHTSMPPAHTAIGILSRAITRLEGAPEPPALTGVTRQLLETIGPEMAFGRRIVFANLWLFGPLVARRLAASPTTSGLVRTTSAVTEIRGGVRDNVLPESARAVANFRLVPGDTAEGVLSHVRATVADPAVQVTFATEEEAPLDPSKVSPTGSTCYARLERTIRQVFPDALVAPFLVTAGTDSRHYEGLTEDIYRFLPVLLHPHDFDRIHGTNERIGIAEYARVVGFYIQLIRNSDDVGPGAGAVQPH